MDITSDTHTILDMNTYEAGMLHYILKTITADGNIPATLTLNDRQLTIIHQLLCALPSGA